MLAEGTMGLPQANPVIEKVQKRIAMYWASYDFDDNGFELKDCSKAHRMEKSSRARQNRKFIKMVKQRQEEDCTNFNWQNKKLH